MKKLMRRHLYHTCAADSQELTDTTPFLRTPVTGTHLDRSACQSPEQTAAPSSAPTTAGFTLQGLQSVERIRFHLGNWLCFHQLITHTYTRANKPSTLKSTMQTYSKSGRCVLKTEVETSAWGGSFRLAFVLINLSDEEEKEKHPRYTVYPFFVLKML